MPTAAKGSAANPQPHRGRRPCARAARYSRQKYSANKNRYCDASATWRKARSHKVGRQANSSPPSAAKARRLPQPPDFAPRVQSSAPAAPCMAKQNSVYQPNHWKVEGSAPRSSLNAMLTQGRLSV